MGPVPEEFVENVRSGIDIVELISEYVPLKKSGQNYMGLCPFHREKTPSFSVSPAKQIFYCFGCGIGGNVFSFLMKMENLPFLQAVELLADRLGMDVPLSRGAREKHECKERFCELNAQAAKYYHRILLHEAEAEGARRYLTRRGVKRNSWERFLLGFAPDSGSGIWEYLRGKGFSLQEICQLGLFSERYGSLQELFRGRVIFPICDVRGRCLGFGGRSLGNEEPKYLNSPESFIFNKSRNLYGLHLAVPAVRQEKRVIVVEGYLDCITVQEYGFSNTVAALGTAFTQEQSRLLLRYTKDIILAFDQDAAGSAATMRGAGFLQEMGARVSVLDLPQAKDPDEYLRSHGRDAFADALENCMTDYFEFRLEQLLRQYNPDRILERGEIARELMEEMAKISNYVVREGFIQMAAQKMHTSEEAVSLELTRYLNKQRRQKDKTDKNRDNMVQGKQTFENSRIPASEAARRGLFRFMCQDPRFLERVQKEHIDDMVFTGELEDYRKLFEEPNWASPAELIEQAAAGSRGRLAGMLISGEESYLDKGQKERLFEDYIRTLKKEQLSQVIEVKQATLRKCEKNDDQEGIKSLLAEIHLLYEELEQLKKSGI